jgi:dihydroorotate dehydrogenase (NAD+) catalytic subunit
MGVDLRSRVGDVELSNPVLLAAGTAGHGAELGPYLKLSELGGVVSKSLSPEPHQGNPAPRLHPLPGGGMLNSVGLQNPGVGEWIRHDLPDLLRAGARVVASIWGRTIDDYSRAAAMLGAGASGIAAVEVNLSCPNLGAPTGADRHEMFASSAEGAGAGVRACAEAGLPVWAKLSPMVPDIAAVAAAALEAGATAVTLVNTMPGMVIDLSTRRPALGAGGGGMSGPPLHPVAVRAVWECRRALGPVPIVAAGGVRDGATAVELLLAGASAVQVGTATFQDPAAGRSVVDGVRRWCDAEGVAHVSELIGAAHD